MKYPYALFLYERSRAAHGPQRDFLPDAFHFQGVAWLQAQTLPKGFGDYDAAGFVDYETCTHWFCLLVQPVTNTISAARRCPVGCRESQFPISLELFRARCSFFWNKCSPKGPVRAWSTESAARHPTERLHDKPSQGDPRSPEDVRVRHTDNWAPKNAPAAWWRHLSVTRSLCRDA